MTDETRLLETRARLQASIRRWKGVFLVALVTAWALQLLTHVLDLPGRGLLLLQVPVTVLLLLTAVTVIGLWLRLWAMSKR